MVNFRHYTITSYLYACNLTLLCFETDLFFLFFYWKFLFEIIVMSFFFLELTNSFLKFLCHLIKIETVHVSIWRSKHKTYKKIAYILNIIILWCHDGTDVKCNIGKGRGIRSSEKHGICNETRVVINKSSSWDVPPSPLYPFRSSFFFLPPSSSSFLSFSCHITLLIESLTSKNPCVMRLLYFFLTDIKE